MHLRSGKKTIFTPSPPRKRSPPRQQISLAGGITPDTNMATATHCAPPETITPPYTPVTIKPEPRMNDWSDLEVVCDLGPAADTWNSGGVPESGTGAGLYEYVCGVGSGEGRERAVTWKPAILLGGLVVIVFIILYAGEGDWVNARVGDGYKGAYEGLYLWEWGFLLLSRFIWNRGEVLVDA